MALKAESAPLSDWFAAAGACLDLEKAYETVCFLLIWSVARFTGFPLRLMAWIISLYSGPRWLVLQGVAAALPLWPRRSSVVEKLRMFKLERLLSQHIIT